ncbi:MAG: prepilin-type N-terminal cleavage/methylation domain-containing protein [Candidatus Pacebacteria bacterium]|jgi:prepilin-type N-terminal cleavage/methylation domain-containing protein|nr:prepilin-type N-terminal cleavage/methylation domain-containing protein [Candidatus Paceibacterota bacterium]
MQKKTKHISKEKFSLSPKLWWTSIQQIATGFTLIEVMIAVALFTVIMTVGIGAVLNSNSNHKKTQTQRQVIDNLSFIMEDMSRNLRLGSAYHCGDVSVGIEDPLDCQFGQTLAFESVTGVAGNASDQVVYGITSDGAIIKSTDSGATAKNLTPPEVLIDPARSGFSVTGAAPYASGDRAQPRVIIRLSGKVVYRNIESEFNLQTVVTQRLIDL